MPKELYIVQVMGLPVKVYAASKTQAELAAKQLERNPPPDLSKDAQTKRMADALAEARTKK